MSDTAFSKAPGPLLKSLDRHVGTIAAPGGAGFHHREKYSEVNGNESVNGKDDIP